MSEENRQAAPDPRESGWLLFATLSIAANVYTRFRFGERFIDYFGVLLAFALCAVLAVVAMEMRVANNSPDTFFNSGVPIFLYGIGIPVLAAIHRSQARTRRLRGEAWHSQINGLSWLLYIHNNSKTVHCYYEPLTIFFLGYIINSYVNWMLGGFLMASAFGVFAVETHVSARETKEMMDMRDQQLEAERRAELFRKMHPDQSKQESVHQARRPDPIGNSKKSGWRFWRR
jgi:hypothetical protein